MDIPNPIFGPIACSIARAHAQDVLFRCQQVLVKSDELNDRVDHLINGLYCSVLFVSARRASESDASNKP